MSRSSPAAGEMVLFDRSWYNRAMSSMSWAFAMRTSTTNFCAPARNLSACWYARGIILIKYWFSVSDQEQEHRFQARLADPTKRWKLSPMDLESRRRWVDYSRAKDQMFSYTDIKQAPWYVVNSDDKRRAHLNVITHLLGQIPHDDLTPDPMLQLPPRQAESGYVRPPITDQTFVPEVY